MRKPKRGEIALREVTFSKADFEAIPEDDRVFFFMAAQTANELAMLRAIIIQSLDSSNGDKALGETGLGLAFFSARLLAGRITEGWTNLFQKESKSEQFRALWEKMPTQVRSEEMYKDVSKARAELIAYFSQENPLLKRVRDKLAFHLDKPAIVGAFAVLKDDMQLTDFHSGFRGSTFYSGADTVMALAASHLIESQSPTEGMNRVIEESNRLGSQLETVIDAYLVAFVVHYFGVERIQVKERIVRFMPEGTRTRLRFYFDTTAARRMS